jgi:hypothetical protein
MHITAAVALTATLLECASVATAQGDRLYQKLFQKPGIPVCTPATYTYPCILSESEWLAKQQRQHDEMVARNKALAEETATKYPSTDNSIAVGLSPEAYNRLQMDSIQSQLNSIQSQLFPHRGW